MTDPIRVLPQEAREKARAGTALLVCGYEDEEKFKMVHLEGAVSLTEFQSKLPSLEKDHEIIFYCA